MLAVRCSRPRPSQYIYNAFGKPGRFRTGIRSLVIIDPPRPLGSDHDVSSLQGYLQRSRNLYPDVRPTLMEIAANSPLWDPSRPLPSKLYGTVPPGTVLEILLNEYNDQFWQPPAQEPPSTTELVLRHAEYQNQGESFLRSATESIFEKHLSSLLPPGCSTSFYNAINGHPVFRLIVALRMKLYCKRVIQQSLERHVRHRNLAVLQRWTTERIPVRSEGEVYIAIQQLENITRYLRDLAADDPDLERAAGRLSPMLGARTSYEHHLMDTHNSGSKGPVSEDIDWYTDLCGDIMFLLLHRSIKKAETEFPQPEEATMTTNPQTKGNVVDRASTVPKKEPLHEPYQQPVETDNPTELSPEANITAPSGWDFITSDAERPILNGLADFARRLQIARNRGSNPVSEDQRANEAEIKALWAKPLNPRPSSLVQRQNKLRARNLLKPINSLSFVSKSETRPHAVTMGPELWKIPKKADTTLHPVTSKNENNDTLNQTTTQEVTAQPAIQIRRILPSTPRASDAATSSTSPKAPFRLDKVENLTAVLDSLAIAKQNSSKVSKKKINFNPTPPPQTTAPTTPTTPSTSSNVDRPTFPTLAAEEAFHLAMCRTYFKRSDKNNSPQTESGSEELVTLQPNIDHLKSQMKFLDASIKFKRGFLNTEEETAEDKVTEERASQEEPGRNESEESDSNQTWQGPVPSTAPSHQENILLEDKPDDVKKEKVIL